MSNVNHESDPLVTTAEAAELLGVGVATINRWAASGELPTAAKGNGLRGPRHYRRSVIEKRLQEIAVAS